MPPKILIRGVTPAAPVQLPPLHLSLRPSVLEGIVGHPAIVKSLASALSPADGRLQQTYLFTGPSGVGKTTLARIVALHLNCQLFDIDAGTHSGVETMRVIIDMARYPSFGDSPRKAYVIDECHALSAATWKSLLKATEEPEPHTFWLFCTTEPDRVPVTVRTRSLHYDLKPIKWDVIAEYLVAVCKLQGYTTEEALLGIVARKADGSMRQALVFLQQVHALSKEDAVQVLQEIAEGETNAVQLARVLVQGRATWAVVQPILAGLKDVGAESVRMQVVGYVNKCLVDEINPAKAAALCGILESFCAPFYPGEKQAPLYLAVARLVFGRPTA